MYKAFLFFSVLLFNMYSLGQKIEYTKPESVANEIGTDDYKQIVDIAVPIVQKRYKIEFVKEGTIQLVNGEEMQAFNLDNLVLKCTAVKDKNLWKNIIEGHFNQIFISIDEQKKIDPKNFETVRRYLSIRIYPSETVIQRGGISNLIVRKDLEDTYSLLMLDLPGAFKSVEKEMFNMWRKDSAEVFQIAQNNINAQKVEIITQKFNIDGSDIEISFIGDENYAASYALDLPTNSPALIGEWGSVIAIPNKGLVNICKISHDNPLDFVKFIQATTPMIHKSYMEHPQPISDQYFWYYKGKFTKINVLTDKSGQINVISPSELTELITTKK